MESTAICSISENLREQQLVGVVPQRLECLPPTDTHSWTSREGYECVLVVVP